MRTKELLSTTLTIKDFPKGLRFDHKGYKKKCGYPLGATREWFKRFKKGMVSLCFVKGRNNKNNSYLIQFKINNRNTTIKLREEEVLKAKETGRLTPSEDRKLYKKSKKIKKRRKKRAYRKREVKEEKPKLSFFGRLNKAWQVLKEG